MRRGFHRTALQMMGLALTSLALPGCPMVQDFELESREGDAGSARALGSFGGAGGDGTVSPDPASVPEKQETDDSSAQLPPAVSVSEAGAGDLDGDPGSCPEVCTGGCADGRCRIDCIMDEECKEAALVCPAGFDCVVSCLGRKSCEKASIECASEDPCHILCDAEDGCKDADIFCGDGECALECGSAHHACEHATLTCGAGSCAVICASEDNLPSLDGCDTAAECQTCDD